MKIYNTYEEFVEGVFLNNMVTANVVLNIAKEKFYSSIGQATKDMIIQSTNGMTYFNRTIEESLKDETEKKKAMRFVERWINTESDAFANEIREHIKTKQKSPKMDLKSHLAGILEGFKEIEIKNKKVV